MTYGKWLKANEIWYGTKQKLHYKKKHKHSKNENKKSKCTEAQKKMPNEV